MLSYCGFHLHFFLLFALLLKSHPLLGLVLFHDFSHCSFWVFPKRTFCLDFWIWTTASSTSSVAVCLAIDSAFIALSAPGALLPGFLFLVLANPSLTRPLLQSMNLSFLPGWERSVVLGLNICIVRCYSDSMVCGKSTGSGVDSPGNKAWLCHLSGREVARSL